MTDTARPRSRSWADPTTPQPRLGNDLLPGAMRPEEPPVEAPAELVVTPIAEPTTRAETLGIFLGFGLLYAVIGLWVVGDLHVVNFDALDRLNRALMVWFNDPPKLAAIGNAVAPVGTLALIPLALIPGLASTTLALPLTSAVLAAGALVFVDKLLAGGDMSRGRRLPIVALVALNPLFAYYAVNGTGDAAYLLFGAVGLYGLLSWGRSGSTRHLIGAGLALALAALSGYEFIVWGVFFAFLISGALTARGRSKDEVEGTVIAYMAPVMYAIGLWLFFNAVVLGDPLAWISAGGGDAAVNAAAGTRPEFDLAEAIGAALRIQLVFPLALVAIPLLLSSAKDAIGYGLCGLIAIAVGYPVANAAVAGSVDVIELRSALPAMIAGLAGIAWVHQRAEDKRSTTWGLAVAIGVIALPLAWSQMGSYPHQNLEQAFTRAISSGDDQEGTTSIGGYQVGIAPEREMADFIGGHGIGDDQILTDEARTYGVIDLTGEPGLFLDRVDRGDSEWERVLASPSGRVDYMLVARGGADRALAAYPGADRGDVGSLTPVAVNDRYALLQVLGP